VTEDEHEFIEERAGILEFEAGFSRAEAEREARRLMLERKKRKEAVNVRTNTRDQSHR
jgi:hypothetical protein